MCSSHIFRSALFCTVFFYAKFDLCMSPLDFLTITVGSAPSFNAEAMDPGFSVALQEMARKYPALYQNYNITYVDIEPLGMDVCTPVAQWKVTERISQLYGSGSFQSTFGTKIMLTPGKTEFLKNLNEF
jgi:hypothetical protein